MSESGRPAEGESSRALNRTDQDSEHKAPGAPSPKGYTAVLYFHGMGNQRRYEEVSRLVDALDAESRRRKKREDELRNIHARAEPPRVPLPKDVTYISCFQAQQRQDKWIRHEVRFHEVYWAPITAEGVPFWEVVNWLLGQMLNPVRALLSPWRLRARLRRAALYDRWERDQRRKKPERTIQDLRTSCQTTMSSKLLSRGGSTRVAPSGSLSNSSLDAR
jgi:hypothetical protein